MIWLWHVSMTTLTLGVHRLTWLWILTVTALTLDVHKVGGATTLEFPVEMLWQDSEVCKVGRMPGTSRGRGAHKDMCTHRILVSFCVRLFIPRFHYRHEIV